MEQGKLQQTFSIEYIFDNGERVGEKDFVVELDERQVEVIENAFDTIKN